MTARFTEAPAPAKLNLFLHVLSRRADGHHELQTVFRLIDRADVWARNGAIDEPPRPGKLLAVGPTPFPWIADLSHRSVHFPVLEKIILLVRSQLPPVELA